MSLYKLEDGYFVKDGHNRVSVARFHGAEWIDAEVTEFWTSTYRALNPLRKADSYPRARRRVNGCFLVESKTAGEKR